MERPHDRRAKYRQAASDEDDDDMEPDYDDEEPLHHTNRSENNGAEDDDDSCDNYSINRQYSLHHRQYELSSYSFSYFYQAILGQENSRLRFFGLAVLAVLFVAGVVAILESSRRPTSDNPLIETDFGFCMDPVLNLKSSSVLEGLTAGVAADHALCSQMGMTIMRDKGGNAIDAAVTTALCLGVANPGTPILAALYMHFWVCSMFARYCSNRSTCDTQLSFCYVGYIGSSGLGGGAFLLIHADPADETKSTPFIDARTTSPIPSASGKITEVIDCREVAPSAASTNMYEHLPASASTAGGLAVAVPGELRGLELAHLRHGRLSWETVVDPVVRLAVHGVVVNPNLAHEIALMAKMATTNTTDYGLRELLTRGDSWNKALREGELLQNQKLGELLEDIMRGGSDALYVNRAAALAKDIRDAGGIVTAEDIQSYKPTLRSPVVAHHINGFSIVGVPPPSSGGAAIIGAARFLSGYDTPMASFPDTLSVHRMVEACKHVFAVRMSLSDPAFNSDVVADAVNDLVNGDYMQELRRDTNDNDVLPLSKYGGKKWAQLNDAEGNKNVTDAKEGDRRRARNDPRHLLRHFGYLNDHGTSHFSVVDNQGNSVTMTTSVNTYFGSKVVSKSTGIVLGNTMDDFSKPGIANYFGVRPSESNYIKPGKKPLSSMSPTMVFQSDVSENGTETLGPLVLAIGASGGPKIISAVMQVYLNVLLQGMSLFRAIVRPRLHDQLIYNGAAVTTTENNVLLSGPQIIVSERTRDALSRRNHRIIDIDYTGTVQAILVDPETKLLTAACDVRKGGTPSGY
jgi:gamma-glutamyltranspeptidase